MRYRTKELYLCSCFEIVAGHRASRNARIVYSIAITLHGAHVLRTPIWMDSVTITSLGICCNRCTKAFAFSTCVACTSVENTAIVIRFIIDMRMAISKFCFKDCATSLSPWTTCWIVGATINVLNTDWVTAHSNLPRLRHNQSVTSFNASCLFHYY